MSKSLLRSKRRLMMVDVDVVFDVQTLGVYFGTASASAASASVMRQEESEREQRDVEVDVDVDVDENVQTQRGREVRRKEATVMEISASHDQTPFRPCERALVASPPHRTDPETSLQQERKAAVEVERAKSYETLPLSLLLLLLQQQKQRPLEKRMGHHPLSAATCVLPAGLASCQSVLHVLLLHVLLAFVWRRSEKKSQLKTRP